MQVRHAFPGHTLTTTHICDTDVQLYASFHCSNNFIEEFSMFCGIHTLLCSTPTNNLVLFFCLFVVFCAI